MKQVVTSAGLSILALAVMLTPAAGAGGSKPLVKVLGEKKITLSEEEDFIPSFSPDGRRIVFTSYASGNEEIWVMNVDGSDKRQLTHDPRGDWSPAWSPDGTEIIFTSGRSGINQIWTMRPDGSDQRPVTTSDNPEIWSRDPSWSADGKRIVFTSNLSGKDENWVMDRDGKNWLRHSQGDGEHWHPSFGPTSERILFSSNRSGEWGLWMSDLDGNNMVQVAADKTFDNNPSSSWSPDGTLIAFRTHDGKMWISRPDGSNATLVVSDGHVAGWRSSWSPDGKKLAYTSYRAGSADIWVISLKPERSGG